MAKLSNREAVCVALADEQNAKNPSEAVILACKIYLRLVPETEAFQRHLDWLPED